MIKTNTKAIARQAGITTAEVNSIARDLGLDMEYRSDLRHWDLTNRAQAAQLADMLQDRA